jgi:hypothetical protein
LDNQELIQQSKPYVDQHVECLQLKIKDDFILCGDLMKSLTVLRYNNNENKFEEVTCFFLIFKLFFLVCFVRSLIMLIYNGH